MQTDNYNLLIMPGRNKVLLAIVDVFMVFLMFGMFAICECLINFIRAKTVTAKNLEKMELQ